MSEALTAADLREIVAQLDEMEAARRSKGPAVVRQPSMDDLRDALHDPRRKRLSALVGGLSRQARSELIALMLLGRGDFDGDYSQGIKLASEQSDAEQTGYILGKTALLARYLRKAMEMRGIK